MTKFPEDNGLWFYEASEHSDVGFLIRRAPNGQVIAEIDLINGAEDYARLIASAPALLIALKGCVSYLECFRNVEAGKSTMLEVSRDLIIWVETARKIP